MTPRLKIDSHSPPRPNGCGGGDVWPFKLHGHIENFNLFKNDDLQDFDVFFFFMFNKQVLMQNVFSVQAKMT